MGSLHTSKHVIYGFITAIKDALDACIVTEMLRLDLQGLQKPFLPENNQYRGVDPFAIPIVMHWYMDG